MYYNFKYFNLFIIIFLKIIDFVNDKELNFIITSDLEINLEILYLLWNLMI